jgi:hypothetical protein
MGTVGTSVGLLEAKFKRHALLAMDSALLSFPLLATSEVLLLLSTFFHMAAFQLLFKI